MSCLMQYWDRDCAIRVDGLQCNTVGLFLLHPLEGERMLSQAVSSQADFYREFLMGRGKFDPSEFGVNLEKDQFTDQMVDDFGETYRGQWTIDELCLHPREAVRFCDDVRRKHGYFDLPDDVILRVIMGRRKNP